MSSARPKEPSNAHQEEDLAIAQTGRREEEDICQRRRLRDGIGAAEAAAEDVVQLKSRLEKEAKANATASKVVAEAKKARDALMGQLKTLRDEGGRLANELKRAFGDADKREAARRQAVEKIAELRADCPSHRGTEAQVGRSWPSWRWTRPGAPRTS